MNLLLFLGRLLLFRLRRRSRCWSWLRRWSCFLLLGWITRLLLRLLATHALDLTIRASLDGQEAVLHIVVFTYMVDGRPPKRTSQSPEYVVTFTELKPEMYG